MANTVLSVISPCGVLVFCSTTKVSPSTLIVYSVSMEISCPIAFMTTL